MGSTFYRAARAAFCVPRLACIREHVTGHARANREGPFILACSHISHLEPVFVSSYVRRHIRWMSRIEFYRPPFGTLLDLTGAFPVDRFGNPSPAIRTAVRLLNQGEIIGMFPEGGVSLAKDSVLRGAPIKQGVCSIAIQTQAPVIPVVVLGTHTLNAIKPWLPTKSARVYIAFGEEVQPPQRSSGGPQQSRRTLRQEMAPRLIQAFTQTYRDLLQHANLSDTQFP